MGPPSTAPRPRPVWRPSTHPPATAWPFTAATNGIGSSKTRINTASNRSTNARIPTRSRSISAGRSRPALKADPCPVITAARASPSWPRSDSSRSRKDGPIALAFPFSSRIRATSPLRSMRMLASRQRSAGLPPQQVDGKPRQRQRETDQAVHRIAREGGDHHRGAHTDEEERAERMSGHRDGLASPPEHQQALGHERAEDEVDVHHITETDLGT